MNRLAVRAAIVLVTASALLCLQGCREKHEPLKPTVATAAPSS